MEIDQFDAFTREMGGSSRRKVLRTLWSALLAGTVVSLGLPELAQANAKRHKARHQHTSDARQAPPRARGAHAAGKGRGKKKKAHRRNPPPAPQLPPGPQCASDEKRCVDVESPTGFSCIPLDGCCLDQKPCGGTCIYRQACCEADRPQCGPCDEAYCDMQGNFKCAGTCCPHEKPCPGGGCVAQDACCAGEKPCDGGCIPTNQCCSSEAPPVCAECEVARCVSGSWGCWPDETCGPQCGDGYCPHGMSCHHAGTCCGIPDGGTYWTCVCASGYRGGAGCTANGQCCRYGCCYPDCCPAPQP